MSQERTEMGFGNFHSQESSPYSRNFDTNGTIAPGMGEYAPGVKSGSAYNSTNEPVVGFLYSISRQGIGEFWPLHLGRNTIGRSEKCDICLKERTVSEVHAVLNVKQMKTTGKLLASLRDEGGKNGLFVNDEELEYDSFPCKNHDILTVGLNYKLLLILVDAEELGLHVSKEFIPVNDDTKANDRGHNGHTDGFGSPYGRGSGTNDTISIDGMQNPVQKTEYL